MEFQHLTHRLAGLFGINGGISLQPLDVPTVPVGISVGELTAGQTLAEFLDQAEHQIVEYSLAQHRGNRNRTARALGCSRSTLFKRLKQWGLTTPVINDPLVPLPPVPPPAQAVLTVSDLPVPVSLDAVLAGIERCVIDRTLARNRNIRARVFKELGMSRSTFFKRLRELNYPYLHGD